MTEKEILACIALVVIACFVIEDILRTAREDSQAEDSIWNYDLHDDILRYRLENQKETIRQLLADMRTLREENARLYKECVVLHQGQKREAEDGKKERNEKV
jgi:NH3-dependent NAD+ synthetase|nr:MAG TPA: hypothetical protein [Caudoviricetes sp.]